KDDRHRAADGARLAADVVAGDTYAARGGGQRGREDGDRRGLARAVGTQQGEELARLHVEAHAVDRVDLPLPVALDEIADLDGGSHRPAGLRLTFCARSPGVFGPAPS